MMLLVCQVLAKASSEGEDKDRILSIIKSIGVRGFLLLEPECKLILEGTYVRGFLFVKTFV